MKLVQAHSDHQAQRRQNTQLEKQLGRVKVDQLTSASVGGARRPRKTSGVSDVTNDGRVTMSDDLEQLQLRLCMTLVMTLVTSLLEYCMTNNVQLSPKC